MNAPGVQRTSPPTIVGIEAPRKNAAGCRAPVAPPLAQRRSGACAPLRRGPSARLGAPAAVAILVVTLAAIVGAALVPARAGAEAQAVEGKLLDRVVAVISPVDSKGQRILITLSDLDIEARLALIGRGGLRAAAEEELPPEVLASTLDWLISEHLLLGEAEQLSLAAVEPGDVAGSLEELEERLGPLDYQRLLQRLELSEGDLLRVLRRRIVVDRYLASRLRLGAVVSEAEVRRAFDDRKEELGLEDFAAAREGLRAQLERQRREEVVSALVADLRSRAQVRVLHAFGVRGQGDPAPARGPASGDPASAGERGKEPIPADPASAGEPAKEPASADPAAPREPMLEPTSSSPTDPSGKGAGGEAP